MMERLFWPDLFIVGGGISKEFGKVSAPAHSCDANCPCSIMESGGHYRRGTGGAERNAVMN